MSNILIQSFTPNTQPPGLPPVLAPQPAAAGHVLPSPQSNNYDEFSQLLETTWRGIPFPSVMFSEKNSHSLVKHLYPNLDNARVANTGFNPREWQLTAHLTNNIFPDQRAETWQAGNLFLGAETGTFALLTAALQNKTSGQLQHPIIGNVTCKVVSWDWKLTGDGPRDGVVIDITFLECIDDNAPITTKKAAISTMYTVCRNLDNATLQLPNSFIPPGLTLAGLFGTTAAYIGSLAAYPSQIAQSVNSRFLATTSNFSNILANAISVPGQAYDTAIGLWNLNRQTLFGTANFFQAINFTSSTLRNNNGTGFLPLTTNGLINTGALVVGTTNNNVTYNLQPLIDCHVAYQAMYRTNNITAPQLLRIVENFVVALYNYFRSLNDNQTSVVQQGLLQFLYSIQSLQLVATQNKSNYVILSFVNQMNMTFLDVANYTNNQIDDIMTLNAELSNLFIIPANSNIQYYSSTGK